MSDPWIRVWLQGGPVHDWGYFTLIEPPDEIKVIANPTENPHQPWIRVASDWPDALHYRRERSVEQFDSERIYYPVATP